MNTDKPQEKPQAAVASSDLLARLLRAAEGEKAKWQGYACALDNHGQDPSAENLRATIAEAVRAILMRANAPAQRPPAKDV